MRHQQWARKEAEADDYRLVDIEREKDGGRGQACRRARAPGQAAQRAAGRPPHSRTEAVGLERYDYEEGQRGPQTTRAEQRNVAERRSWLSSTCRQSLSPD